MITWPDFNLPPINLYNVWHYNARITERDDKWRKNYLRHTRNLSAKTSLDILYTKRMVG